MKYRKKPVVVEAYQTDKELDIETLEGTMHASVWDYIITGVRGEQYPCKPDIFEQTYEPADTPASPWHRVEKGCLLDANRAAEGGRMKRKRKKLTIGETAEHIRITVLEELRKLEDGKVPRHKVAIMMTTRAVEVMEKDMRRTGILTEQQVHMCQILGVLPQAMPNKRMMFGTPVKTVDDEGVKVWVAIEATSLDDPEEEGA